MSNAIQPPLLEMTGITKRFPGVLALREVDLVLNRGEILILVGENGAGKSTLMKILAGVYRHDSGSIQLNGRNAELGTPHRAREEGISIVFQEQALIPDLDAIENIFIGNETTGLFGNTLLGTIDRRSMTQKAAAYLEAFSTKIDVRVPVRELGMGKRQVIEIIRGLVQDSSIFILDEPTAALEDSEREQLFEFLRKLKNAGVGIIFCSHHLEECLEIGDRVMVLRDGSKVGDIAVTDASVAKVIELMIGKSMTEQYPKRDVAIAKQPVLRATDLTHKKAFRRIDVNLYEGEILGISGLVGSGKSELARAIFGAERLVAGSIEVGGKLLPKNFKPYHAVAYGIGFLPSDRKSEGLFLDHDVTYNISISNLKELIRGWIRAQSELKVAAEYISSLKIKTPSSSQIARNLSGGNQQKLMLARWLFSQPKLLIFEDPTRGIDVNAKVEVYNLIGDFVATGGAVIIVSSDLPELEGICDRVIVMRNGSIAADIPREQICQQTIAYECVTRFSEGI
jgi:ribose transport system ATP-binding protein